MDRPRVYVETTVPSAYLEERAAPEMVERRRSTRQWWSTAPSRYEMFGSVVLLHELSIGTTERVRARLELVADLRILEFTPEIHEVAEFYVRHKLMPGTPSADAYHLAFASCHGCDYLVSWNYRHLVNKRKFHHVRKINALLGLVVPELVTPAQMHGGPDGPATSP